MEIFDVNVHQHRRYNPLLEKWILVSPHRMNRPWNGGIEKQEENNGVDSKANNPLAPLGRRPNNVINPDYKETFIFENDFPAIKEQEFQAVQTIVNKTDSELFQFQPAIGKCYVVCYHPSSSVSLATMEHKDITKVMKKLIETCLQLQDKYMWIQVFENKGEIMGCSNPHPHCQIWASSFFPTEPLLKDKTQHRYFLKHKSPMLLDYLNMELHKKERIVVESSTWVCLVPYWAEWPYETYLLPKKHILRLQDMTEEDIEDLSIVMKQLLCKYDNLFNISFPYSMGWHGAPTGNKLSEENSHWQLHAVYFPPFLRSATVKKFMVGYEMMAETQRDLTPEKAAETLRNLPVQHYKTKMN